MGWVIVIGCTKKQFQIANLFEVNSKLEILRTKHFTNVKFQNVLMGSQGIKRKINLCIFFNVFWNLFVLSKNKFEFLSFQFHTHVYI